MPKLVYILSILWFAYGFSSTVDLPDSFRAKTVRDAIWPILQKELSANNFKFPAPLYIRIFKDESLLEIWAKSGKQYRLFKSYDICYFTGGLGTKMREGDGKSPEGFYALTPHQLNPLSNYYLAINVGYPNKLERLKGYTGDAIMIHGHCASIGCYAMTNPRIEEIYTLVYEAFKAGQQQIRLDIFPFRMDEQHLKKFGAHAEAAFWKTMEPGYTRFEKSHLPAEFQIRHKSYAFAR